MSHSTIRDDIAACEKFEASLEEVSDKTANFSGVSPEMKERYAPYVKGKESVSEDKTAAADTFFDKLSSGNISPEDEVEIANARDASRRGFHKLIGNIH